jgi:hypothetical protein
MTSVLESRIKNTKEIENILSTSSSCSELLSEDKKIVVRETLTKERLQEMINNIKTRYDTPINDKYNYLFNIIKCRREILLQYEKDPSKLSVNRNTRKLYELEELEKQLEEDKKKEEEELHKPVKKPSMVSSMKSVFGFSKKRSPNKGGRRKNRSTKKVKRSSRK